MQLHFRSFVRSVKHFKINPVIKVLIVSDVILWASYNMLAPIYALFVVDTIPGATITTVGISMACYMVAKAVCEIPAGYLIDRTKTEHDDFITMFTGSVAFSVCYFLYMFVGSVAQLYALNILFGVAAALAFPGWWSIFTRHVDRDKTAFEWSLYDVTLALGIALAAIVGAVIAKYWSFSVLFLVIGLFNLLGSSMLLFIRKELK